MVNEGLLQRMQASAGCQSFDRLYLRILALYGQGVASEYGCTIHQYSACTTRSLITGDLGAEQLKVVAKQLREGRESGHYDVNRLRIDTKRQTAMRWRDVI